jgi:hypothetical protein
MAKHSQNIPMINVRVSQIHDDVSPNTIIFSWWSILAQPRSSCSMRTAELHLLQATRYLERATSKIGRITALSRRHFPTRATRAQLLQAARRHAVVTSVLSTDFTSNLSYAMLASRLFPFSSQATMHLAIDQPHTTATGQEGLFYWTDRLYRSNTCGAAYMPGQIWRPTPA